MLLLFDDGEGVKIDGLRVDRNVGCSGNIVCDIFVYKLCIFCIITQIRRVQG